MKRYSKLLFSTFIVFALCFSILILGSMGKMTPKTSAVVTVDEAKLCLMLSTPINGTDVDMAEYLECLAHMDEE